MISCECTSAVTIVLQKSIHFSQFFINIDIAFSMDLCVFLFFHRCCYRVWLFVNIKTTSSMDLCVFFFSLLLLQSSTLLQASPPQFFINFSLNFFIWFALCLFFITCNHFLPWLFLLSLMLQLFVYLCVVINLCWSFKHFQQFVV
jgi:hypothetical protein